ncbi:Aste57867_11449 [Aphanomyces stellatus]|uniref:Aste57867_11449 protein n=1 Tax=Aphanomyces stellatus TaxID=120398 RepID=A0A485KTF3_9STRA|nr:hypothetical protein As57867_011407 [Aphanomyces stellatus]VFT88310.1 Aste57867_11449 [Aphanomyces stellatus]
MVAAVPNARMRLLTAEPLSRQDRDFHFHQAQEAAAAFVLDSNDFQLRQSTTDVAVFEDMVRGRVKATTTVHQPAHVILASSLQSANSHDFRRRMFHYFGDTFANGLRLHSDSGAGYVSMHWLVLQDGLMQYDMAFASSTLALCRRDRGVKTVPLTDSTTLGVQLWWSVPDLVAKTIDCARVNLVSSGFLVEALDDATSTISFVLQFGPSRAHPTLAWMRTLAHAVVASFRRSQDPTLPPMLWTGNAYCYLCFKTFGLWHRRHHCRFCGHAICTKCTTYLPPNSIQHPQSQSNKPIPACIKCPDAMMQRSVQLFSGVKSPHGITTWSSIEYRIDSDGRASRPRTPKTPAKVVVERGIRASVRKELEFNSKTPIRQIPRRVIIV